MNNIKFQFGNIVVVDNKDIGVIVKSWADDTYEVYVRNYGDIREYPAHKIDHYVYNKALLEEEYGNYE